MESIRSLAGLWSGLFSLDDSRGFVRRVFGEIIGIEMGERHILTFHFWARLLLLRLSTGEHPTRIEKEERGGGKKCVETRRSIEARSTQLLRNAIHSITYVFIRQIGDERTASTRKWKLAANSYGFWRLSGFLTTPSANCLILKKKKKKYQKCLERSNKRYALYIFVSFSLTRFQLFHPSPLPRKETYNCLSKSNEKKEKLF